MRRALIPLLGSLGLVLAADCNDLRVPVPRSESAASTPAQPAARDPNPAPARRAPGRGGSAIDVARFEQVRRGLRRLVVAEENYYAENGVYTENLPQIGFRPEGESRDPVPLALSCRVGRAQHSPGARGPGLRHLMSGGSMRRQPRAARRGQPGGRPGMRRAARSAGGTGAGWPNPVATARPASDTGSALDEVDPNVQMQVDLRNLARLPGELPGGTRGRIRRMEPFALQFLWRRGVGITILGADDASWSAMATHARRPGKSCVIWVGPVSRKPATLGLKHVPDDPGTPICNDSGPRRRPAIAHRRHLRENRQRRFRRVAPTQGQPDRPVDAGDIRFAEAQDLSRCCRGA